MKIMNGINIPSETVERKLLMFMKGFFIYDGTEKTQDEMFEELLENVEIITK
tara:strand:- start:4242 stop:4397 length:156 start_codon:yes stop_codon:yes gene_type:complete